MGFDSPESKRRFRATVSHVLCECSAFSYSVARNYRMKQGNMNSYFKSSDHYSIFERESLVTSFTKEFMVASLGRGKIHQFLQYYPSPTAESKTSTEWSVLQHLTLPQHKGFLHRKLCRKTLLAKLRALSGLDT